MRSVSWLPVALVLVAIPPALAEDRPIVAVFDLEVRGPTFDAETVSRLTDYLGSLMARKGFKVVPRSQLKARLTETKKGTYQSCYDESCQIEIGKELAASKSLASQVLKIGSKCKVTVNLFDLKSAASDGAGAGSGGCDEDGVVTSLEAAVDDLLSGETAARRKAEEASAKKAADAAPAAKKPAPGAPAPGQGPARGVPAELWKEYAPAGAGFTVLMPGNPFVSQQTQSTEMGEFPMSVHVFEVPDLAAFMVFQTDFPAEEYEEKDGEAILEDTIYVATEGARLVSQENIELGGHPGRDYVLEMNAQGQVLTVVVHAYWAGHRLYRAMVSTRKGAEPRADIEKFLGSFRLKG